MSWNQSLLSSGSKDCSIVHSDIRAKIPCAARVKSHQGEVFQIEAVLANELRKN